MWSSPIAERQRQRAARLYQPMSSPVRRSEHGDKLRAQMRQVREDLRVERLAASREKRCSDEDWQLRVQSLEREAAGLQLDLDLLLAETEHGEVEALEAFLADAESDLEAQLRDMQISTGDDAAPAAGDEAVAAAPPQEPGSRAA